MIYALLRSPLLTDRDGREGLARHGDEWSYSSALWSCLWHDELARAVYPLLQSYHTPMKEAYPRHSLSRTAITASQEFLFLLDAFTQIIVLYATGCPPSIQFPPGQDTLIKKQVKNLQSSRRVTPIIRWIHEDKDGQQAAQAFYRYLIDEPQYGEDDIGQGYVRFLEEIRKEAHTYIKEQQAVYN
eukprot:TRINITY_DN14015_c0_g2_i2.p2 TRINITY_DN14015_c0_g2~~TRINITY_DN14015_c0_g2_i2.p2  ORF type:complete len:185 (+),score=23.32 TRINITY_DN14015_c0_g2_i2:76-630(+)